MRLSLTLDNVQNIIPVAEDLLEEPHNSKLLTLLYRLAEWHALAKLRMHTEHTLQHLEKATVTIGKELRSFRDSSSTAYVCKELPGETRRRARRQRNKRQQADEMSEPTLASSSDITPPAGDPPLVPATIPELPPKIKKLNLLTYKLHALGDYVRTIRLFGTTDSYSTQIVSITSTCRWAIVITISGGTCPSTGQALLWTYQQEWGNQADSKT